MRRVRVLVPPLHLFTQAEAYQTGTPRIWCFMMQSDKFELSNTSHCLIIVYMYMNCLDSSLVAQI